MDRILGKLPGQRASMCYSALHKLGIEHSSAGLALRNKREELDFYLTDQPEYLHKRVKYLSIVWGQVLAGMNPDLREIATAIKNQVLTLANNFDLYKRSDYKPRVNKVRTILHSSLKDACNDSIDKGGRWDPALDSLSDIGGGKLRLDVPSATNESSNIAFIRVFLDRNKSLSFDDPAIIAAMDAVMAAKIDSVGRDFWSVDISKVTADTCLPGQPDPIEDLTTWIINEQVAGRLVISGTNKVDYQVARNESTHLTKDWGVGFWTGDFEVLLSSQKTAFGSTSIATVCALSMVDADAAVILASNSEQVGGWYVGPSNLNLHEIYNGVLNQDTTSIGTVLKYMTFSRTGSNAAWDNYDDAERTIPFGSASLGLNSIEPYQFSHAGQSFNSGGSANLLTGYTQDIDFQLAAAASSRRRRMFLGSN